MFNRHLEFFMTNLKLTVLFLLTVGGSALAQAPATCPDFTGSFQYTSASIAYAETITQSGCDSLTDVTNISNNGTVTQSTFTMVADGLLRATGKGTQAEFTLFTSNSLVSTAAIIRQNPNDPTVENITTTRVVWTLDQNGNKVVIRQNFDENGQPYGAPTTQTWTKMN